MDDCGRDDALECVLSLVLGGWRGVCGAGGAGVQRCVSDFEEEVGWGGQGYVCVMECVDGGAVYATSATFALEWALMLWLGREDPSEHISENEKVRQFNEDQMEMR